MIRVSLFWENSRRGLAECSCTSPADITTWQPQAWGDTGVITKVLFFFLNYKNLCQWVTALHSTQRLEADLISAEPGAVNCLVSELVTGFLARENQGSTTVSEASSWKSWAELSCEMLSWRSSLVPIGHIVALAARGSSARRLLLPEGWAVACAHFTRKSVTIITFSQMPHLSHGTNNRSPAPPAPQFWEQTSRATGCWRRWRVKCAWWGRKGTWHL